MSIIIKTEKVWKDNVQCRKIIDFKALDFDSVPKSYLKDECCCFVDENKMLVVRENYKFLPAFTRVIHKNSIYTEGDFQTILKLIRKAGDRLMKINKQLEQERQKQWSGKEKFVI